jgi:hypothetical protein
MKAGDNWQVYGKMNKDRDAGIETNKPPGGWWQAAAGAKSFVPRINRYVLYRCAFLNFDAFND